MRYRFIEQERVHYPVIALCRLLAVSRSSFYAWRQGGESRRAQENRQLLTHIRAIYRRSKQRYGSPRIHDALRGRAGSLAAIGSPASCNKPACRRADVDVGFGPRPLVAMRPPSPPIHWGGDLPPSRPTKSGLPISR